jgi:hypothetical protein
MNNSAPVCFVDCRSSLFDDDYPWTGNRFSSTSTSARAAIEILHYQVGNRTRFTGSEAKVGHIDNVRA